MADAGHDEAFAERSVAYDEGSSGSDVSEGEDDAVDTTPVQVKMPSDAAAVQVVACGEHVSAAVDVDGRLYTWGRGSVGQLGRPEMGVGQAEDGKDEDGVSPRPIPALRDCRVVDVALGVDHGAAIGQDGQLWTWGSCLYGQLGTGRKAVAGVSTPALVRGPLAGLRVMQVACGRSFTVCCTDGGDVFAWGSGPAARAYGGGRRRPTHQPARVPFTAGSAAAGADSGATSRAVPPPRIKAVACGDTFALAMTTDGGVFAWGTGAAGELGLGPGATQADTPTAVTDVPPVAGVACGASHAAAVTRDGKVFMWGSGSNYKLGNGSCDNQWTPQPVENLCQEPVVPVQAVRLGPEYTAAVMSANGLYMWGRFHYGTQLGASGRVVFDEPVEITASGVVASVACGHTHVLATLTAPAGAVAMWGFVTPKAHKPFTDGATDVASGDPAAHDGTPAAADRDAPSQPQPLGLGDDMGGDTRAPLAPVNTDMAVAMAGHDASDAYTGALESLTAILDLSPHATAPPMAIPSSVPPPPPPPATTVSPSTATPVTGAPTPASTVPPAAATVAELQQQLEEAQRQAAVAREEASRWKAVAREAQAAAAAAGSPSSLAASATQASRTPSDPQLVASVRHLKSKAKSLALAVVQARVKQSASVLVHSVMRNHLATTAAAFRRWTQWTVVAASAHGGVVVGASSTMQANAGAGAGAGAGADAGGDRDAQAAAHAKPLVRAVARLHRMTLRHWLRRWKRGRDWSRADDNFRHRTGGLRKQVRDANKAKKLAHQRVQYMRDVMTGRLIKTQLRYGRDKLVALLQSRRGVSKRVAFERWRLHASSLQQSESLRRGRVKLQVGLDQVRAQRGQFERSQRELGHAKRLFSAYVAFHKWKALQQEARRDEALAAVRQERQLLVGQLRHLYRHMQSVKEAQEHAERAAMERGGTVLEDVRALEESILSWYTAENEHNGGQFDGGHGDSSAYPVATVDHPGPTRGFVVGPSALSKSRAYDMARSLSASAAPTSAAAFQSTTTSAAPGVTTPFWAHTQASAAAVNATPAPFPPRTSLPPPSHAFSTPQPAPYAHSVQGLLSEAGLHTLTAGGAATSGAMTSMSTAYAGLSTAPTPTPQSTAPSHMTISSFLGSTPMHRATAQSLVASHMQHQ